MTTNNNEVVQIVKQRADRLLEIFLAVLLAACAFFLAQTFSGIKSLEKEMKVVSLAIERLETSRITRQEIKELIIDYHNNHPCQYGERGKK